MSFYVGENLLKKLTAIRVCVLVTTHNDKVVPTTLFFHEIYGKSRTAPFTVCTASENSLELVSWQLIGDLRDFGTLEIR